MNKKIIALIIIALYILSFDLSANPKSSVSAKQSLFPFSGWQKLKGYQAWAYKDSYYKTDNQDGSYDAHIWAYWNAESQSVKALVDLDCRERMVGASNVSIYSGLDLKGTVSENQPDFDMKVIEPDTFYYVLFKRYCNAWWQIF